MSAADRLRDLHEAATQEVCVGVDRVQTNEVSRSMAMDAGEPGMEGMPFFEDVEILAPAWHGDTRMVQPIIDATPALIALIEAAEESVRKGEEYTLTDSDQSVTIFVPSPLSEDDFKLIVDALALFKRSLCGEVSSARRRGADA